MDGKVAGIVTWKASEGENVNFAVPSNLILGFLTKSEISPLGTQSRADLTTSVQSSQERVWTSMRTGNDYKSELTGIYVYVIRANFPPLSNRLLLPSAQN